MKGKVFNNKKRINCPITETLTLTIFFFLKDLKMHSKYDSFKCKMLRFLKVTFFMYHT